MGTTNDDSTRRVDEATREEERKQARANPSAGRGPTPEEERAAEQNAVDPSVARENKAAVERGAKVKGEGQVD